MTNDNNAPSFKDKASVIDDIKSIGAIFGDH